MTNTQTEDSLKTASQIKELYDSGSELVRITVNNEDSAKSVIKIKDLLVKSNYNLPWLEIFIITATPFGIYPETASILDKYRINPGNVGSSDNKNFTEIINIAKKYDKA